MALKFKTWRQSRQIRREIAWIQETVRQIQKSPNPAPDLIQTASTGRWETAHSQTGSYLIFSNGWAACKTHSWHRNDGMDDMTVLKMSDGIFYLSRYHFESGIQNDTLSRPIKGAESGASDAVETASLISDHPPQPANVKDFLENGGRWQGWYRFSRDGKLQCIVRSPYEDHRLEKKGLWVWIGTFEETGSQTLFQKRFFVSASRDMTWTANWTSDDEITLDVFDYGGNSPRMMGVDFQKRLLATLIFQRDQQSGKFTEKTNILRYIPIPE